MTSATSYPKRLIEVDLPIKRISERTGDPPDPKPCAFGWDARDGDRAFNRE